MEYRKTIKVRKLVYTFLTTKKSLILVRTNKGVRSCRERYYYNDQSISELSCSLHFINKNIMHLDDSCEVFNIEEIEHFIYTICHERITS